MPSTKMPKISTPPAYRNYQGEWVVIPKEEYQRLKDVPTKWQRKSLHQDSEQTEAVKAWQKVRGMLKGPLVPDPMKWQRRIRKEWDRELP